MSRWYRAISATAPADWSRLMEAIDYYEGQLEDAREEIRLRGNLEAANKLLPGIVEHRFSQLQEIEAILEFMNILYNKTKGQAFRRFLENYAKDLSSRDADKFAETEDEVINLALLRNEVALLRNKYLSIMRALEQKSFAVSNITKLRVSGLEDISLN